VQKCDDEVDDAEAEEHARDLLASKAICVHYHWLSPPHLGSYSRQRRKTASAEVPGLQQCDTTTTPYTLHLGVVAVYEQQRSTEIAVEVGSNNTFAIFLLSHRLCHARRLLQSSFSSCMAHGKQTDQAIHLVLDWDGTLTVADTMSVLAAVPQARDHRLNVAIPNPRPSWENFYKKYMTDYTAVKNLHYPNEQTVTPERYSEWLERLRGVEYGSARRVSDSDFFKGVTTYDVVAAVTESIDRGSLRLREGWHKLFHLFDPSAELLPKGSEISILSVNFSSTLIRSALRVACRCLSMDDAERLVAVKQIDDLRIISNEIEGLDRPEGSTGQLLGSVRTAKDKLDCLEASIIASRAEVNRPLIIYVGDSATDYECLHGADIGVWLRPCKKTNVDSELTATFKPLRVDTVSLADCIAALREGREMDILGSSSFSWAENLHQIAVLLEALSATRRTT
jgi:thiamine phosphate phosphatase / amino-HMP aminohydrolase